MAYEWSRVHALAINAADPGTAADSPDIDSAFTFESAGDCYAIRFTAPVSQTAATLTVYVYTPTVTGTPTFQIEVRDGYSGTGDVDRPATGGSNLASSPSSLSLSSADNNTWVSLTCTVSLTLGLTYWVILKNTHGTPTTNHAQFRYNGSVDAWGGQAQSNNAGRAILAGYNSNATNFGGADATFGSGLGSVVVKFSDGTLLGQPYVTTAAHASDTNSRGNRLTFSEDVVISGMVRVSGTLSLSGCAVYPTGGGAALVSATGDGAIENATISVPYRFAPTTIPGGTAYDYVCTYASSVTSGSIVTMGEAEADVPTDVKACRPFSCAYVDGATPGSFTVDTSRLLLYVGPVVDDFPAIAGGTTVAGTPMRRGMV